MAVDAVLFDVDDTLVWREQRPDYERITALQAARMQPICARLGFETPDLVELLNSFWITYGDANPDPHRDWAGDLEELRWNDGALLLRGACNARGMACSIEAAVELWHAIEAVPVAEFGHRAFDDAAATIARLHAYGYRLGVVTSRMQTGESVRRDLLDLGLPDVFDTVVTSATVGYRKPHPLLFAGALAALELPADRALMVGDSYQHDLVPAAALGMATALKRNFRPHRPEWLRASHRIDTLHELLAIPILDRIATP